MSQIGPDGIVRPVETGLYGPRLAEMWDAYRRGSVAALERARRRIENPDRWSADHWAENSSGSLVRPKDPEAVAWCLNGACNAEDVSDDGWDCVWETADVLYRMRPDEVNDQLGHDAVLRVLDDAIARAKEGA